MDSEEIGTVMLKRVAKNLNVNGGAPMIRTLEWILNGEEVSMTQLLPYMKIGHNFIEQNLFALVRAGLLRERKLGKMQFFRVPPEKISVVRDLIQSWRDLIKYMIQLLGDPNAELNKPT